MHDQLLHRIEFLLSGLSAQWNVILLRLEAIERKVDRLTMTQDELATKLGEVTAQVAKIGTEVSATLQKVTELEAALAAAGNTTPAVDAALAALKAQAQKTDDLIPDAPAPPTP